MPEKPIHVGVLVMTRLGAPYNQFALIARKRTNFNLDGPDGTLKKQSFNGCYQVTAHGKPKEGEAESVTLAREVFQELGLLAGYDLLATGSTFAPQLINSKEKADSVFNTYVAYRPVEFLTVVQMDCSGYPELILEEDLPNLGLIDKATHKSGVKDGGKYFFDDELAAVLLAFATAQKIGIEKLAHHFSRRPVVMYQE